MVYIIKSLPIIREFINLLVRAKLRDRFNIRGVIVDELAYYAFLLILEGISRGLFGLSKDETYSY